MKHYFKDISDRIKVNGVLNKCQNCGFLSYESVSWVSHDELNRLQIKFFDAKHEPCVYQPGCLTDNEYTIKSLLE